MSKCIKSLSCFIILSFFIVGCGNNSSDSKKPADATYGVKSGIVTFENIFGMKGKNVVFYFDDYGKKEAYVMTDEDGSGVRIKVDSVVTEYSTLVKKGKKTISHASLLGVDLQKYLPNLEEIEEKEFLGKKCKGYKYTVKTTGTNADNWFWEGILLYSETFMDSRSRSGGIVMEASKLEVNVRIPADKFQVPPDISIQ